MNQYEFHKTHYFHEISRKDQLTNFLALPIGIVTILAGVLSFFIQNWLAYYLNQSNEINQYWLFFIIILITVITTISLFLTIIYLFCSYIGYTYCFISTLNSLREYRESLIDWYKNNNKPIDEAEKEFEEVIIEKYAKCTEQNTFNNDQKSSYLNRANYFLLFSLVSIIVCMALFVISAIVEPNLLANSIK